MFKKIANCLVILLVILPLIRTQVDGAMSASVSDERLAQRVKAGIIKLGVGPEARVRVKLKDKTTLVGYISKQEENYFEVMQPETGMSTAVTYPNVVQVQGNNLSTRTKIIIAASIIAGVIIVLYIVRGAFCDGC